MRILKVLVRLVLIVVAVQIVVVITGQILRKRYLSQEVDEDSVNAVAVMRGLEESVTSKAFKGGYLRAVMGGVELDLSNAGIELKPATIDVTVFMGGAEIDVPADWNVTIDVGNIMGGVEHKRGRGGPSEEEGPDLVITGKVVMGGLEVTS